MGGADLKQPAIHCQRSQLRHNIRVAAAREGVGRLVTRLGYFSFHPPTRSCAPLLRLVLTLGVAVPFLWLLPELLTKPWLPNSPLLLRKLSRRSRTRSPAGYVWSPTNSQNCSSASMCFASSACKVWYDVRDRVSRVQLVARSHNCQWTEFRGSKALSTYTTSSTSKMPSRK